MKNVTLINALVINNKRMSFWANRVNSDIGVRFVSCLHIN